MKIYESRLFIAVIKVVIKLYFIVLTKTGKTDSVFFCRLVINFLRYLDGHGVKTEEFEKDEKVLACQRTIMQSEIPGYIRRLKDDYGDFWDDRGTEYCNNLIDQAGYSAEQSRNMHEQLAETVRHIYRREALRSINRMRQGEPTNIKLISWQAWAAGVTLEELGTSESEVAEARTSAEKDYVLGLLRYLNKENNVNSVVFYINSILAEIKRIGCTLEELGTSQQKIQECKQAAYFEKARMTLESVRTDDAHPYLMDSFWFEIEMSGRTIEDLGTTQEELSKLDTKICKRAALASIAEFRQGADYNLKGITDLKHHIARSDCRLEELGTSKEEISSWEKELRLTQAKYWLEKARMLPNSRKHCLALMRKQLDGSGIHLSYIGTSNEELTQLGLYKYD
jgi:hypothetical protein